MAALAQEYAVRSRISDQILATKIAFVNALRAGEGVRVAQSTLDAYREQLRITTELWKQGTGQRIDVYRATSQVANAEKDLVERQNDLDMARSVLNDEIGVPLDSNMSLEDVRESISKDGRRDSDRSETLIELAKRQRSESKSAALGVIAAQKGIKLARSSSDPTVLLALSGSYFPTTSFTYPRQSVGVLTLSVNIPIFDGGEARARVEEARATLDTVKTQEQQVQRAIALQVQNAWDGVLSARKSLQAAITSLTAAISARNLAGQRFENQVGLYLEVTDSQAALSAAQASQINAAYDLLIADAQLQRATGDLTLSAQENRIK
jgi:outer membrane protein TolC